MSYNAQHTLSLAHQHMPYHLAQEHLLYFKDLIEGNTETSFRGYFRRHEQSLKESLGRASFLRLKFEPIEEIEKILSENQISYSRNESAIKQEKYFMCFHEDVLDEHGKLHISHKRNLFDHVIAHYLDGALEEASARLSKSLGPLNDSEENDSHTRFEDAVSFAETEFDYGDKELGIFILNHIASLPRDHSSIDKWIFYARKKLVGTRRYD